MTEAEQILKAASSVLLVDWPGTSVPRSLLKSGLKVFGFSPSGYSAAELVGEAPQDVDPRSVFAPSSPGEAHFLVFRRLALAPSQIDVVCIYRPAGELEEIIKKTSAMRPKLIWLQPPITSSDAHRLATQAGAAFVEGSDIADVASRVRDSAKEKN